MILLIAIVILVTLTTSFLCSLLEGYILSTTTAEVEALKAKHPTIGARLEYQKNNIERATAAILTLNTLVNTGGSAISGYLCGELFGSTGVAILTALLTFILLFFCEILPKSIGVLLRQRLGLFLTPVLDVIMLILYPISELSKNFIHAVLPRRLNMSETERQQELLLLVNKAHTDGVFSITEREMIANTLRLDDIPVTRLMTSFDKMVALPADEYLGSVMRHIGTKIYSRLPVYDGPHIVGIVLRDDLLHASALDNHTITVRSLIKPVLRISSEASLADLLQQLLKNRQEMCIVEGLAQQTLGLVTMDDVIKHLLGHHTPRT